MDRIKQWTWVLFPLGAACCLGPWGSPGLALGMGAALALMFHNPFARQGHQLSKWLLQVCVVLLGFSMDLREVIAAGRTGALFAAASILMTFVLGALIGRWLRTGRMISLLVSAGTAICGGSAIAAIGAVSDADEADMTVAIGTVFLLNAIALYAFPLAGHWLHMTSGEFGTWSGIAIHDISSVVGAASNYSNEALETATAVKLSRALWIIPVAGVVAWWMGRQRAIQSAQSTPRESDPQSTGHRQQVALFDSSRADLARGDLVSADPVIIDPATATAHPVEAHPDAIHPAREDRMTTNRVTIDPLTPAAHPAIVNPDAAGHDAADSMAALAHPRPARRMQIPWFIGLFLLASIVRTLSPAVAHASGQLAHVARLGFTLTLFMIGAGLSMKMLKAVGWRPLVQGVILWVFISLASMGAILWLA